MPGFRGGKPAEDRQCRGISKRTSERCGNWAMTGRELCSGHAGYGSAFARVNVDLKQIEALELAPEQREAALEHLQVQLESKPLQAMARAEARRKDLAPPPLTESQRAAGLVHERYYGPSWAPALQDERGRAFRWVLTPIAVIEQRAREELSTRGLEVNEDGTLARPRQEPWWKRHNRRMAVQDAFGRVPGEFAQREREREIAMYGVRVKL